MNKKYALLALILLAAPIAINTRNKMSVAEWQKVYYVNDFTEEQKSGIASFAYYLVNQRPSEQNVTKELKLILAAFPGHPNDFRLALIKLSEQALLQVYDVSQLANLNNHMWRLALLSFYKPLYNSVRKNLKLISYGPHKNRLLPSPERFHQSAFNPAPPAP